MPAFLFATRFVFEDRTQYGFMLKLNMITDIHIYMYLLIHFSGFDLLSMFL